MRRRGGVDGERASVADVGYVAVELERVDEFTAAFVAGLNAKADEGAEAIGEILLRQVMVLGRFQARVVDPLYFRMGFEVLGDLEGIGAVPLHAEVQSFEALNEQEGVEGRKTAAHIAEELQTHLHDERDIRTASGGKGFEGFPVREAMVGHVRLGKARESAIAPIKVTAVHDDAADGRPVATDMFRRRVDDDISPVLKRAIEVRRQGGVIDDQWDAGFLGNLRNLREGEDIEARVAETFTVKGFGVSLNRFAEVLGIVAVDKGDLNTELGQGVVEKVVSAAVKLGNRDDVVTSSREI